MTTTNTLNIHLGYIIAALFTVPFFMEVAPWYSVMELWAGGFLVTVFMSSATILIFVIHNLKKTKQTPLRKEKLFSKTQLIAWHIAALMAASMMWQEMYVLVVLYLVSFISCQMLRIKLLSMKKPS